MLLNPEYGYMAWIVITALAWGIPIILAVWFVRTLNAMLAAQRDIVE
jgi:hypothetical protein